MARCIYTCLVALLLTLNLYGQGYTRRTLGLQYAYDFNTGNNNFNAISRSHIGLAYYTHVSRLAVMGFGLGYVKYQRNLYGADTVLNPLYAHRMHGAKLLVNLRYAGLHSARGDDIYRINPLIGAGLTGLLWGSQKELANKSSVNYYRLGPVKTI